MQKHIVIIGAGLSGLTLAHLLESLGHTIQIIEARDRVGGRIHTLWSQQHTPIEMGATWCGKQHTELLHLLDTLNLPLFEQFMEGSTFFQPLSTAPPQEIYVPAQQEPSYRIQGGSTTLITALAASLQATAIQLQTVVTEITYAEQQYTIHTSNNTYTADYVISTLPPALLCDSIEFTPSLPKTVLDIALKTHTWMGQSIKFGVSYNHPFWKEKKYSGAAFSNTGAITEVYDHSNAEETTFALKGFLSGILALDTPEHRKQKVMDQLVQFFGEEARNYLSYEETVWANEQFTIRTPQQLVPHQHNGHSVYQQSYFDTTFYIAGSETSKSFGGYMEGAIRSALRVYQQIKYGN